MQEPHGAHWEERGETLSNFPASLAVAGFIYMPTGRLTSLFTSHSQQILKAGKENMKEQEESSK